MNNQTDRFRVGDRVTIYRRGQKKTWVADFWHDGQHRRQTLETKNRKVAHQRALQLELDLAANRYQQPPPAVTVREAVNDYIQYLEAENRCERR